MSHHVIPWTVVRLPPQITFLNVHSNYQRAQLTITFTKRNGQLSTFEADMQYGQTRIDFRSNIRHLQMPICIEPFPRFCDEYMRFPGNSPTLIVIDRNLEQMEFTVLLHKAFQGQYLANPANVLELALLDHDPYERDD